VVEIALKATVKNYWYIALYQKIHQLMSWMVV